MDIVTLEQAKAAVRREAENPGTGQGVLAYAENGAGQTTAIGTAAVADGFCIISFKPTKREVEVSYECPVGISVAPGGTYGGSLDGIVWEVTISGFTPVVTENHRQALDVAASRPTKTLLGVARGSFRVPPSTTRRTFALGAGLVKDNALGGLAGLIRHQTAQKSWIKAVAL